MPAKVSKSRGRSRAHEIAGPARRAAARRSPRRCAPSPPAARRPTGRRRRSRRTASASSAAALAARCAGSSPPCTMPKSAMSARRRAASPRAAHAVVRATARATARRRGAAGTHSSSDMATSTPSASWIGDGVLGPEQAAPAVDVRAVADARRRRPAPRPARLITWKPPLSVRIGRVPAHEPVHAAERLHDLDARTLREVVGVRQHDRRARAPRAAPA